MVPSPVLRVAIQRGLRPLPILACLLTVSAPLAGAAETVPQAVLRLETGMHTAVIREIGVDRANRTLVTGSQDKTVRLWELPGGRLLKILRPPLGDGEEGQIDAVAISPDGKTVACGGQTGMRWGQSHAIYVFDRDSGKLTQRLGKLPTNVSRLAFSPDGKSLVAAFSARGIQVFRTSDYFPIAADKDYADGTFGLDFDAAGRCVTACLDGSLRLYDANFKLASQGKVRSGHPYSVALTADGSKVAVGFADTRDVEVRSGKDLAFLYAPDTSTVDNGNLGVVAWSADGRSLYAGGAYARAGIDPILRWGDAGKGAVTPLAAASNLITHIVPLLAGGIVYASGDPAVGSFDAADQKTFFRGPGIADFRDSDLLISNDGMTVGYSYQSLNKAPSLFSLTDRVIDPDAGESAAYKALAGPFTAARGIEVTDWKHSLTPKFNGNAIALDRYERSRCLAVAPDQSGFVLGTNWALRLYDRAGNLKWRSIVPGTVWGVNVAGNGKVVVAALSDGTIRWYNAADGKELLAFFALQEKAAAGAQQTIRTGWIAWTPTGYYDAAPGSEDIIGWHVNRGGDGEGDFFPASRFRESRYRPGVIANILATRNEAEALRLVRVEEEQLRLAADQELKQREELRRKQEASQQGQTAEVQRLVNERNAQENKLKQQEAKLKQQEADLAKLVADRTAQDDKLKAQDAALQKQKADFVLLTAERDSLADKMRKTEAERQQRESELKLVVNDRSAQDDKLRQQEELRRKQEADLDKLRLTLKQQEDAIKQREEALRNAKGDDEIKKLLADLKKQQDARDTALATAREQEAALRDKDEEIKSLRLVRTAQDNKVKELQGSLDQQKAALETLRQSNLAQEAKFKDEQAKYKLQEADFLKKLGLKDSQQQDLQKIRDQRDAQEQELKKRDDALQLAKANETKLQSQVADLKQVVAQIQQQKESLAQEISKRRAAEQEETMKLLPPVVNIMSPIDGSAVKDGKINLRYSVRMPSGEPVNDVKVIIDGRPQSSRDLRLVPKDKQTEEVREMTVEIPARDCQVGIMATNSKGISVPATINLKWAGPQQPAPSRNLYVLAIGVSKYKDAGLNLNFADKDATDFAKLMQSQKGRGYKNVEVRLLTNDKATRRSTLEALEWISGAPQKPEDVAVIFLSGHGFSGKTGNFFFVTQDAERDSEAAIASTCVAYSSLTDAITSMKGIAVVFIDTCHSGNVCASPTRSVNKNILPPISVLVSAENGCAVFSSSTGNQLSWEDEKWNNGAFTSAIMDGIGNAKADYEGNGEISMTGLELYVSSMVKKLTENRQTPTLTKPPNVPNFAFAMAR